LFIYGNCTGGEFVGLKDFFKKEKIFFKLKFGKNKSNFSEHFIFLIKRRLYLMMRSEVSTNWPAFLPFIVTALNKKPLKLLGNLSPQEINSEWDDPMVRQSQQENNVTPFKEPGWREQNKSQANYEKSNKTFQIGDYVYLDKKTEVFDKSFFAQVSMSNEYCCTIFL